MSRTHVPLLSRGREGREGRREGGKNEKAYYEKVMT